MLDRIRENRKEILLIGLAAALSYAVAVSYQFVMDDFGLVASNQNIKSLSNIFHLFASGYWDSEGYSRGLYRPLDLVSFLVEYTLFGARPFIYHLDNVLLHVLCSVLVFFLVREVSREGNVPLFSALIFAVHPVHTEAVAWISCRGELLSAAFVLLSILSFIKSRKGYAAPVMSWVFFFLALLSKESAAVAPVLLTIWLAMFGEPARGRGRMRDIVVSLLPFGAIFVLFLVMRYAALGILSPGGLDQAFHGVSAGDRFLTMCRAMYEYIRLGFLPFDLRADYFFPPPGSIWGIRTLLPVSAVLLLVALAPRYSRSHKAVFFSGFWFFAALLPVMNIIPANIVMSERVMYMPSIAVCLVLGMAVSSLYGTLKSRPVQVAALAAILSLFFAVTESRLGIWHDQDGFIRAYLAMLEDGIRQHPGYPQLYRIRARIQTRFCGFGPEMDRAVFDAAHIIGNDDFEVHTMKAWVYYGKGLPAMALTEMKTALKMFQNANYLNFTASILLKLGRYDEALMLVDKALGQNPGKADFYLNKGNILVELGRDDEALKQFETASSLDPDSYDAQLEQGILLEKKKDFARAEERIKKAIALNPELPYAHYCLGAAYMDEGRPDLAEPELKKALVLKPDYQEALDILQNIHR